mmetsp:Transcript_11534/g.25778  ORF Transcript_11534/g.25778 Transcript_11534/m.25778 type:complete len:153 (+) Transcript_11534:77-535(+)
MALLGEDDEFFGDDDEEASEFVSGLGAAEAASQNERHRLMGFHEAYEKSEEAHLQRGFETGYKESFVVAKRTGEKLGELAVMKILSEGRSSGGASLRLACENPPATSHDAETHFMLASREIRNVLTAKTTTPKDLEILHAKIEEISVKGKST